jgi:integrase/recombinase XerC
MVAIGSPSHLKRENLSDGFEKPGKENNNHDHDKEPEHCKIIAWNRKGGPSHFYPDTSGYNVRYGAMKFQPVSGEPIPALLGVPTEEVFLTVRDCAMLETLYSAALIVSELCEMNWQDVDWNKRQVNVLGKGNKERVCPLGQKALEALLEYSRHYEHKWEKKPDGPALVFLSNWNMRINIRTIPRTIRKWCKLAGVKHVNPHAFRHSAATHMLENGADIRVIQKLLGHASIITTEIYTQVAIRKVKTVHANTHPRA